jgi:hypothetical protein
MVLDEETQSIIGPFNDEVDAASFIAKVESESLYNISSLEAYEVTSTDDWMFENIDNILMSNC